MTRTDIDDQYHRLKLEDKDQIVLFYKSHPSYFEDAEKFEGENQLRFIRILSCVGVSLSFNNEHVKALKVLDRVILLYRKYASKLNVDLSTEIYYKLSRWNKGYSLYKLERYMKARPYLKEMINGNNEEYSTVLKSCNWHLINKLSIALGVLGVLMTTIRLWVKYISPENYSPTHVYSGYVSGLMIVLAGILYKRKIK